MTSENPEAPKPQGAAAVACTNLLGAVERTSRGFEFIEFKDCYGEKCSLQASSLAEYEKPGTSAVWLGCEEARKHPVTGEPLSPRMHLNRDQVTALIAHLQSWLDNDTFAVAPNDRGQARRDNPTA